MTLNTDQERMDQKQFIEKQIKYVWTQIPALKYKGRAERILSELFSETYEKGWADSNNNHARISAPRV